MDRIYLVLYLEILVEPFLENPSNFMNQNSGCMQAKGVVMSTDQPIHGENEPKSV